MNISNRRPPSARLMSEAWTPGDSLQFHRLLDALDLLTARSRR